MLVLAHRGYHETLPENSFEAFDEAVRLGVDGIETDIRLSVDGELILRHDRLAPDGRLVSTMTRTELSHATGHEIPTLRAAVERNPHVLWNLEIKTPSALGPAMPVLKQLSQSTRLLVSSFWHRVILKCARTLDVECGLLVGHCPQDYLEQFAFAKNIRRVRTIIWDFEFIEAPIVQEAAANGFRNYVYSPHGPTEHAHCAQLGVDGVITDTPECLSSGT